MGHHDNTDSKNDAYETMNYETTRRAFTTAEPYHDEEHFGSGDHFDDHHDEHFDGQVHDKPQHDDHHNDHAEATSTHCNGPNCQTGCADAMANWRAEMKMWKYMQSEWAKEFKAWKNANGEFGWDMDKEDHHDQGHHGQGMGHHD